MVSVTLIQRHFERGGFDKLAAVLRSSAPGSLPLRARLAHQAPATGLALRRVVELTYGPTNLSRTMVGVLIHLQRSDGSFAGASERDPIATAAAAAGLGAVVADPMFRGQPLVETALDRAIQALASMQDGQGLFSGPADRTWQDRALTTAFIVHVLANNSRFRETVRLADIATWFDEHAHRLDDVTRELFDLAWVSQPGRIQDMLTPLAA